MAGAGSAGGSTAPAGAAADGFGALVEVPLRCVIVRARARVGAFVSCILQSITRGVGTRSFNLGGAGHKFSVRAAGVTDPGVPGKGNQVGGGALFRGPCVQYVSWDRLLRMVTLCCDARRTTSSHGGRTTGASSRPPC